MAKPRCACGCGAPAVHRHHAVKEQTIEREGGNPRDPRWIIGLAFDCHLGHHGANGRLPLRLLPDEVFAVAVETFGPGRAYNELRRAYTGADRRLDALLDAA